MANRMYEKNTEKKGASLRPGQGYTGLLGKWQRKKFIEVEFIQKDQHMQTLMHLQNSQQFRASLRNDCMSIRTRYAHTLVEQTVIY